MRSLKLLREKVAKDIAEGKERTELDEVKDWYREHPADFMSDWGVTFDPRNADIGLPPIIPFVLFPKQREWVEWVVAKWRKRERGLTEKSRDVGLSWLSTSLACTLCLFHDNLAIGFGSRVKEYVDQSGGSMKPLLPKARVFMKNLPEEFRGGWDDSCAPYMRLMFPNTGSMITGEGGDQIGRGDRQAIYFIDEAAYLERAELVENSLSFTTNCRIDLSSVSGMNTVFARNRWGGKIDVFIFDWKDDPRKDQDWYDKLPLPESEGGKGFDPVTIAQEVDRDYLASVSGVVIPGAWVRSAVGACGKLALDPTGAKGISLDVADEGIDKNALCFSHGVSIEATAEWSGKGADIFDTVERTFRACDEYGVEEFDYDSDGLGAGVRGDARVINDRRKERRQRSVAARGWRGSEAVVDPEGIVEGTKGREGDKGRTNKDFFANRKAQGWWALRARFQKTHRWVVDHIPCNPDDIVNIDPSCPNHLKLVAELSQPTYETNGVGKIVVHKTPPGMKSPNLADAVMIRFAPKDPKPVIFTPAMVLQLQKGLGGRRVTRVG